MTVWSKLKEFCRQRKHLVWIGAILVVCFAVAFLSYRFVIVNTSGNPYSLDAIGASERQVSGAKEVRQAFSIGESFNSLSVQVNTNEIPQSGQLTLTLADGQGETVFSGSVDLSQIDASLDDQWVNFNFGKTLPASESSYQAVFSLQQDQAEPSLRFLASDGDSKAGGAFLVDGVEQAGDLSLEFFSNDGGFVTVIFWIAAAAFTAFLVLLYFLVFMKKKSVATVFLVCVLFLGVNYMLMMTPYSSYDEPAHFDTAYRYSNQLMFKGHATEDGGYLKRAEDSQKGLSPASPNRQTIHTTYKGLFKLAQDETLVDTPGRDVAAVPYVYLPGAVGITVARLLHLGQIPLFELGRLCNLLVYAFLAYFAIKRIPFGKMVLFTVALLPMSVHQAASFSYDAIVNGLALFYIAHCIYVVYSENPLKVRDIVWLCVAGALLAPCKSIYVVICFLCVLVSKSRFQTLGKKFRFIAIVLGVCLLSYCIFNLSIVYTSVSTSGDVVDYFGKPSYTMSYVLHNPLAVAKMFVLSFFEFGDYYLNGITSGLYMVDVPFFTSYLCIALLILSALKVDGEKQYFKVGHRLWMVLIMIGVYVLAHLSMLVAFTPEGEKMILGVQGRYMLPALAVLVFAFRNNTLVLKKNIDRWLMAGMCILQTATLLYVFSGIIAH